jgi:hypothetical protein
MPTFGKVTVDYSWIFWKTFIISLMMIFVFTPLIFLIVPVLICLCYLILHEFIHAYAIIRNGGLLTKIHLGLIKCYVDFQMPTIQAEKAVYRVGVLADMVVMALLFISLSIIIMITKNPIFEMWGLVIIIGFTLEELLPEHSDLQEYNKRFNST